MHDNVVNLTDRRVRADPPLCGRCELGALKPGTSRVAVWRDEGLLVIEGIPAHRCPTCGEKYIDPSAARFLKRMRHTDPKSLPRNRCMIVPVVDFKI